MIPTLDYAKPSPHAKNHALSSMLCGLCSGPAAYVIAMFSVSKSAPWSMAPEGVLEALGLIGLVIPLAGSLAFAWIVNGRLSGTTLRRGRVFATIGIVAPIVWGIAIIALIVLILNSGDF